MDHVAKLGQKILSNALNLKVTPALANLTERRHLLRVLQQFGEVLVFKSFFYDQNSRLKPAADSALVIFRNADAFDRVRQASPITFELQRRWGALPLRERPLPQDEYSHKGMWKAPDANPMTTADNGIQYPTDLAVDEAILDADHTAERTATAVQFQLTAEPWEGNHRNYLQQTPLWGPFEITPNIVQKDLERIVPMIGLSDIDVRRDSPPPRVLHRWSETMARRKTLRQMHEEGKLASQEPRKTEDAGDTG